MRAIDQEPEVNNSGSTEVDSGPIIPDLANVASVKDLDQLLADVNAINSKHTSEISNKP